MKLHALEVEDFRGIRRASVTFGPGLTVLHGPNELGKSTLVEAIHAALFMPSTSSAGQEQVPWGTTKPAMVALTFEHDAHVWKVTKRFGTRPSAKLESRECGESGRFHDVAEGRDVEGRIRDLLAWGIAPPGGRGAAPKSESFLLTALVGRQGEVQKVFEASLADDKDGAGRSLVNQALGALNKDPLVGLLLDKLATRVELFFTEQGALKRAADSPLVKLQENLRKQQALLATLQADAAKGETIQADVVRLQDEHARLVAELCAAKTVAAAAELRRGQLAQRSALQATVDGLRERLAEAEALRGTVTELEAQLAACDATLVSLRAAEREAAAQVEQTRITLQAAAADVARAQEALQQSAVVQQTAADKRRAELELAKQALVARLTDVRTAEEAEADVEHLAAALAQATVQRGACAEQVTRAERVLEQATLHSALSALTARQREVDAAAAAAAQARGLEEGARVRLQVATSQLREAEARRAQVVAEPASDAIAAAQDELSVLAAAEAQLVIDRARADVQVLEGLDAQARQTRAAAKAQRERATAVETRVARRTLPTPDQIASWRALDAEVRADVASAASAPSSSSALVPAALAFVAAFVVGAAAAMFALGLPTSAAVGAGLLLGLLAGLGVWASQRGRGTGQAAAAEQRLRRRDRFTQEVQPSLRAAGLASLSDYEGAVIELERQKCEVEQWRAEAALLDDQAAAFERQAAPLESTRAEVDRLERAKPIAEAAAVARALLAHGRRVDHLQRRLVSVREIVAVERQRLMADADAAVLQTEAQRAAAQAEYDALATQLTAADTTLALRRQQVDEAELARVQARLRELEDVGSPAISVDDATRALEEAKSGYTAASTRVQGLDRNLVDAQSRAAERVAALGEPTVEARERAEQDLESVTAALSVAQPRSLFDVGAMATAALDDATQAHVALEAQLAATRAARATAASSLATSESQRVALTNDLALVRGQLRGFDVPALTAQLESTLTDPVFSLVNGDGQPDADAAAAQVASLQKALDQCIVDLSHARGQLHLTAGHVGSERLAQQQERVALADAEVKECERTERGALRLLREIEKAEGERATHLGRVLADPVSQAFKALTGERYGRLSLGPDLRTEAIEAKGETRPIERMSLGAREQLATLLRLAIAGYLRTALVLDDQLVHSDSGRLAWFNQKLRESVSEHGHQVIVFTCRPGDYLRDDGDEGITAIDLTTVVSY